MPKNNGFKKKLNVLTVSLLGAAVFFIAVPSHAQQAQIPSLQVCNKTRVSGRGQIHIASREDAIHTGVFKLKIKLQCAPNGSGYPAGGFSLSTDMSDSTVNGLIHSTSIEQVTTTGKHSPTAFLNGRCRAMKRSTAGALTPIKGCRFWMMIADNKNPYQHGTQDVVSFLVMDGTGKRLAYGTGPLRGGDFNVAATSF